MLTEKQILEIREHLDKAQNPLFFYDNDADGLCSFLLLRRFIDRGKGVAVRSFPDLDARYARKAQELNADYVFILDKPVLSREFVAEVNKLGLPLVWVDHHDLPVSEWEKEFSNFYVYNSARHGGKNREDKPVTYWSYKIANRKEDVWLGIIGCIADHHLPDFVDDFEEHYPELWKRGIKEPFEAYYETEIGRIARAFNFGLKDSVSNVVKLQNFLISVKGPNEIFEEISANHSFRKKYQDIKKKYDELMLKAKSNVNGKIIFFDYSGEISISADISNELSYRYPKKYIIVAYRNGNICNLSIRGKDVKGILDRVLKEVGGTGGGHNDAVGARIATSDLTKFREVFEKDI